MLSSQPPNQNINVEYTPKKSAVKDDEIVLTSSSSQKNNTKDQIIIRLSNPKRTTQINSKTTEKKGFRFGITLKKKEVFFDDSILTEEPKSALRRENPIEKVIHRENSEKTITPSQLPNTLDRSYNLKSIDQAVLSSNNLNMTTFEEKNKQASVKPIIPTLDHKPENLHRIQPPKEIESSKNSSSPPKMKKIIISGTNASKEVLGLNINALEEVQSDYIGTKPAKKHTKNSQSYTARSINQLKLPEIDQGSLSSRILSNSPPKEPVFNFDSKRVLKTNSDEKPKSSQNNIKPLKPRPILPIIHNQVYSEQTDLNNLQKIASIPKKKTLKRAEDELYEKQKIFNFDADSTDLFSLNPDNPIVKMSETPLLDKKKKVKEATLLSNLKKGTEKYSKAMLVKYFDQFQTKIIQPEFMLRIGTMCITELWSNSEKVEYLQEMRGGKIQVFRNRHKEGENYESLFKPDKKQQKGKVMDHVARNEMGIDDTREKDLRSNDFTLEVNPIDKFRESKNPIENNETRGSKFFAKHGLPSKFNPHHTEEVTKTEENYHILSSNVKIKKIASSDLKVSGSPVKEKISFRLKKY